ncbi:MAG: helix-turn-helix transcriptional regulator [Anaerolineae bacterium]
MNLFEFVGQRIRDLRLNYGDGQGLSQESLAKALNVATNTISRWETSTYRPSLEDLDKLARFFGVSILEFFPPEETPANDQITALLRAARQLKPEDLEELRRYAEFRRARSLVAGGERPRAGRKRKETQ